MWLEMKEHGLRRCSSLVPFLPRRHFGAPIFSSHFAERAKTTQVLGSIYQGAIWGAHCLFEPLCRTGKNHAGVGFHLPRRHSGAPIFFRATLPNGQTPRRCWVPFTKAPFWGAHFFSSHFAERANTTQVLGSIYQGAILGRPFFFEPLCRTGKNHAGVGFHLPRRHSGAPIFFRATLPNGQKPRRCWVPFTKAPFWGAHFFSSHFAERAKTTQVLGFIYQGAIWGAHFFDPQPHGQTPSISQGAIFCAASPRPTNRSPEQLPDKVPRGRLSAAAGLLLPGFAADGPGGQAEAGGAAAHGADPGRHRGQGRERNKNHRNRVPEPDKNGTNPGVPSISILNPGIRVFLRNLWKPGGKRQFVEKKDG